MSFGHCDCSKRAQGGEFVAGNDDYYGGDGCCDDDCECNDGESGDGDYARVWEPAVYQGNGQ